LLTALVSHLVIAAFAANAQPVKTPRVAVLESFSTDEGLRYLEAFLEAMRDRGYAEGRNVIFDVRISDRDRARVPELVDELLARKPDVLVSDENAASLIRTRTTTIPIVLTGASDPVGQGLAQSLGRPGMNVTGVALLLEELAAKHVELMREIRPRLTRVGMLVDTTTSGQQCKLIEQGARQAAQSIGAAFVPYQVGSRDEIERAFSRMKAQPPDVLLPCPAALLFNNRDLLYQRAVSLRIPFTSFVVENVPLGVLFSYSPSFLEARRKAAAYVDRILQGARPGDLPIEQATTFALIVNLQTARAMGLAVPPPVRARADRVIE
jgi:putative ABC transport system substrate-binding protein